jgi:murein DD-endopeptidase MepM/ murein hydrolase activator NlpD
MTDATTIPPQLGVLGAPTGIISGPLKIAYGRGGPWSTVNAHDPYFAKHGVRWNVRPSMLKAMEVIESGGRMIPNGNGFPNWGNMQLTSQKFGAGYFTPWDAAGQKIGADITTADGQIAIAAHVLGGHTGLPGTPEEIFLSNYYPTPCLDCPGQDGHTPRQYLEDMKELERQITAAATGVPAPTELATPRVFTEKDILNLISNNAVGVYISFGFNQPNINANGQPVNIYRYGKGHGTTGDNMHPGIDIWMPDNTPVNAVFGGEVVCVGSRGGEVWGQGCGYFSDDDGGLGNITILTDTEAMVGGRMRQLKMTYGHMSSSVVQVGQRVANGERIGRSGVGAGWPHVHLDVVVNAPELNNPQIWNNGGEYHLVDPIPTIIGALGGGTREIDEFPDDPINIPQPGEFEVSCTAYANSDGVKVLQFADPNAPQIRKPLVKDEDFEAVYQVLGNDGRIYWVTTNRSRIPVREARSPDWDAALAKE